MAPIEGTLTVHVTFTESNPAQAGLSGSGEPNWHTKEGNLVLTPQAELAHYTFTFRPHPPPTPPDPQSPPFSLGGLRIFQNSSSNAKIGIPVNPPSGDVTLELLDVIPENGQQVVYNLSIGINVNDHVHWLDPTISFEPDEPPTP